MYPEECPPCLDLLRDSSLVHGQAPCWYKLPRTRAEQDHNTMLWDCLPGLRTITRSPCVTAQTGAVPCKAWCGQRCPTMGAQPCMFMCPCGSQVFARSLAGQLSKGQGLHCWEDSGLPVSSSGDMSRVQAGPASELWGSLGS